jgi:hypothetical protein
MTFHIGFRRAVGRQRIAQKALCFMQLAQGEHAGRRLASFGIFLIAEMNRWDICTLYRPHRL